MTATLLPTVQSRPDKARTEVTLPVDGMTCASCVRRVERALTKVPGVASANVSLATEKATVAFDPAEATVEQLATAVEKAGYRVPELPSTPEPAPVAAPLPSGEITLPIEGMTCASCVRQVERALTKLDGVQTANVNLATEHASVAFDSAAVSVDDLRAAVE